ncbi:MAG TPA: glycosyltransferase family 4 protein [Bacteroidia bacterium]|nr:glycosyltransferase family 4 protein [Bacteroidia bacterium]
MADSEKINLLVIPDLFPKFEGDVQGVFVLDYLKSVAPYCNTTVLFPRLQGTKKGITSEKTEDAIILRYSVTENKTSGFAKATLYFKLLRGAIKEGKKLQNTDIIHAHGTIISGTISYFLARKKKIPFIITEHVGPFTSVSESFWKKTWTTFIMQRADAVLCVSEHQKNEILSCGIKPKKIIVTNNPVDTELFKPTAGRKTNHNILFVGRLDNFKGALRSANAFKQIAVNYPEWKFTVVGDGEDFIPLQNLIKTTPALENRIILKGGMSKKEIANEMNRADFLVFPSRHESFGLVIAEALSYGLPVITTNQTAPKEFVDKENGILISPDNESEIRTAMEKMIKNHSSYNLAIIRSKIVSSFGFENFGKKLADIYFSFGNKR